MSDSGGDMGGGGGGDSGGGGKGSGGNGGSGLGGSPIVYDNGGNGSSASSLGGDSSTMSFAGPPTTDTSLEGFVNDPSQGNLTGPGPVGGGSGIPGDGGGTNTPFSWTDNLPNLNGVSASDFTGGTGAPASAGGVFDTGASPVTSSSGFDSMVSGGSNPAAASAAGTAAPTGVAGNTDISSSLAKPVDSYAKGSANSSGGTGGSGGSNMLSSLGLGGNPLGTLAAGAGLANNLFTGNKAPPQSGALTANASAANATAAQQTSAGQALQQWQTTGKLPDSYESQVQRAAQDAKTRAVSNAAAQGLPTDPTQNTALAQQLNSIDAAIPGQREAIAAQLAQSGQNMINAGLQATGISSGVYQTLANLDNQQNQQRGQAIANFAQALNGGGNKGLTLKVA